MADWSIKEQAYLEKSSPFGLIKSRLAVSERSLQIIILLIVFVVALLPRLLSLDTFITADEDDQIMFASHFLKSVLQGNFGGALVLGYPGVPTLILGALGVGLRYAVHYAGWYPLPWVSADFFTTLDQTTTRFGVFEYPLDFLVWVRVPMALAAALSIVGIYWLAKQLLDERVALFGALLLAFDPFILAHSRVIHVDAPLSYFMFLSFLAFLLYLDRGAWRWLLLSGLFGGLAILSKTPAALLGPILVTSGLLYVAFPPAGQTRTAQGKRLLLALVVWGLLAVAAMFALWPSMWSRPLFAIEWLVRNIQSVNKGAHPTTGVFWGGVETDQSPYYYLFVFPFHLTPLTTVGLLAGVAMITGGLLHRWRGAKSWPAQIAPLLLSLVTYIVVFVMPISAVSRRGDRYILPVYFAVGLLAAIALYWLAGRLAQRLPDLLARFKLSQTRLLGGLVFVQILAVLVYHPYYLAYFNPLIGGPWLAPRLINVGWGEGLDVAARYLNQRDEAEQPSAAAWYSNQFGPYYRGQTVDLSSQEAALTADYTVFYINQVQRGFPSREILNYFRQRDPLHTVHLGGIEYAWIYEGPIISQQPAKNFAFPLEALLGGRARLYGVDVPHLEMSADQFAVAPGENQSNGPYLGYKEVLKGLPVILYWETLGDINTNHGKLNVYIRLVDEAGHVWGRVDRLILSGLWRTDRWQPGYFLRDEYKLPIDPATPPGRYHFEIGLYDFETGQSHGVVKNVGEITLTPARQLPRTEQLNLEQIVSQPLNESLTLVGHTFIDSQLPPGATVAGKIFWQTTQPLDQEYRLEISFLGADRRQYIVSEQPLASSAAYPLADWRTGEIVGQAYSFRIPAVAPPGDYPMQVTILDAAGQSAGQAMTLAHITVENHPRNFSLPDNVSPVSATINDEIELVGYKLHDETVGAKESFGLTLYWRSLKYAESNYTVFVHAIGPDQVIRGQWDSMPVGGDAPTSGWIPGEIIEDHYQVLMSRDVPPWKYDIFVGMYDPLTGQRLPLYSAKAPASENRVWLTRIQATEE